MGRGGEGEMGRKRKYLSSQVMVHSTGLEENFSTWNAIAKYLLRLIKQKQSWKLVQTMNVLQSTLTQGCGTMPSLSLSPPLPLSPSPHPPSFIPLLFPLDILSAGEPSSPSRKQYNASLVLTTLV